jgi:hypothetical protein
MNRTAKRITLIAAIVLAALAALVGISLLTGYAQIYTGHNAGIVFGTSCSSSYGFEWSGNVGPFHDVC